MSSGLLASASSRVAFGDRLFAINRDGTKLVAMLGRQSQCRARGRVQPRRHHEFPAEGSRSHPHGCRRIDGRSLYKVNGDRSRRADGKAGRFGVRLVADVDGNPMVRVTASNGSVRLSRKDAEGKWRKFKSVRLRELKELPDYEAVGPSDRPGEYYVLARPPGKDRVGLYLYDLGNDQFGEPVIENPVYDLDAAQISRDGKSVIRHCYSAHVRICKFADPKIDAHMKGIRKYFEESANVDTYRLFEHGTSILLFVEGPRNPPATTST